MSVPILKRIAEFIQRLGGPEIRKSSHLTPATPT